MNLNKVFLVGRLTQDPEAKTTPSGQQVCTFGLATNRIYVNQNTKERQEKAEYHNIVAWGKLAEIASQYLSKGRLVLIEGRIQTRNWQDTTGSKRFKTEIIAENLQMGPRSSQDPNASQRNREDQKQPQRISQEEIPIIEEKSEEEIDVKDIPF